MLRTARIGSGRPPPLALPRVAGRLVPRAPPRLAAGRAAALPRVAAPLLVPDAALVVADEPEDEAGRALLDRRVAMVARYDT
ncbi:hypothetical protein IDVR_23800 [Intrasporangium sp. DVR]